MGSCVVLCALLFHLFPFGFHCHCFIWVQLFQKHSWECGFNSSWFKTPFGQYAYKVFLLFFENHSFIENHFFTRQSAFLDSFVLLCSPVFSYYLHWSCGFMCCPLCSSLFLCFHLFLCCFHCHCFICVKLFHKQSWECDFNNSWFKAPFEQYAYKVLFIIIWKPFFYRKAFLLLGRGNHMIP